MAKQDCKTGETYKVENNINICYFQGIGTSGSFMDYIINGATALNIKEECIKVYKFIVDNFDDNSEIWMFGLSRGAYTVRCVSGMINNCGIIIKKENENDNNFYYEEVYDQNVSGEVQNVYQALSIHDRLSVFEPCFIRRSKKYEDFKYNINIKENNLKLEEKEKKPLIEYKTIEVWFPGAHYDIGRQRFVFTRRGDLFNNLINFFNIFVIEPNDKFSKYVLKWIINSINENDSNGQNLSCESSEDLSVNSSFNILKIRSLKGDIYNNMFFQLFFNTFNKHIIRERRIIPYGKAKFYEECSENDKSNPDNYISKTYIIYSKIINILENI